MPNELPNPQVKRLHEILNAQDQDNLTKAEATDLGFTYFLENGFTPPKGNLSLPQIYFGMVAENMDTLITEFDGKQDQRRTKEDLALSVAKAIGCEAVELNDVDEEGLSLDFAFLVGIFESYGYIDIYYVKAAFDKIGVSEVSVSDE